MPPPPLHKTSSFQRIASWLTNSSRGSVDFQENEWTPPDSSYGAAIPVGGWIPKNARRFIEWTMIGSFFLALCYFIITTSIRLSEDGSNNSSKNKNGKNNYDGGINLNDDRYIEYNNNDDDVMKAYYNDDDGDDAYAAVANDDGNAVANDGAAAADDDGGGNNNNNNNKGYRYSYYNNDDGGYFQYNNDDNYRRWV